MKKLIMLLALISVIACKKEEGKVDDPSIMDVVEGAKKLEDGADAIKENEAIIKELEKQTPIDKAIYKKVLTEQLGDLKRSSFSTGIAGAAFGSGIAAYGEGEKTLNVTIFDGAGKDGSSLINMMLMMVAMDSETITGTQTQKIEEINGIKCSTNTDTNPERLHSLITFVHNNRFQVTVEGNKMNQEEVIKYMKLLNLSDLK